MAINVTADPIVLTLTQRGTFSSWPAAPKDAGLNQIFYCDYTDVHGNEDAGIPVITLSVLGDWLSKTMFADPITITLTQHGTYPSSFLVTSDPIVLTLSFKSADVLTELLKKNWVKWSAIGSLDFTIGRNNVAGERPLDWKGWVYAVKKLGSKVIAYGENGVSILAPSDKHYGMNTIYRVGLKGKHAVAGSDSTHFFIDNKGQLYSLGEELRKLDYSEYLSVMSDPVMSYDAESDLVYICDGALGYVYSPKNKSLGAGPVNITGLSSQGGTLYVTAPATATTEPFEICTDIYDFGTRKLKTVFSLEFGTDLTETLYASIDFRTDKAQAFSQTLWYPVNEKGFLQRTCTAREFRFRAKVDNYEYFEIDSLKINGEVLSH